MWVWDIYGEDDGMIYIITKTIENTLNMIEIGQVLSSVSERSSQRLLNITGICCLIGIILKTII